MRAKPKKWYIEVLKAGVWHRTWWTGNPDDPDIKPTTYLRSAQKKMEKAQKRFPHATYRIVEALEETIVA